METKGGRKVNGHKPDVSYIAAKLPRRDEQRQNCKQNDLIDICGNIFLLGLIVFASYMLDLLRDKTVLVLAERFFPQIIKEDIETAVEDTDELFT